MVAFISHGKAASFINDHLLVDGELVGRFEGLKEAKEYLEAARMSAELQETIATPSKISEAMITLALNESAEFKVTESLVKGVAALIERKIFYPSNALLRLREQHESAVVNGKIDYVLRDGTTVLLDIETNMLLNTVIDVKESSDLIIHMTENVANFMESVADLLEDNNGN